ncbi:MAG: hypothetical protein ACYCW6_23755 [Candidatus Xenobia bacterium]
MHGFPELASILHDTAADGDKSRMGQVMTRARRAWEDDVLIGPTLMSPRHYVLRELLHDLAISARTIDAFTRACRFPARPRARRSPARVRVLG